MIPQGQVVFGEGPMQVFWDRMPRAKTPQSDSRVRTAARLNGVVCQMVYWRLHKDPGS